MVKLSISNIAWDSSLNETLYSLMQKYAFSGLEIAPTKLFPQEPYSHASEGRIFAADLKGRYGLSISSLQSIWYGRTERLFGTKDERAALFDYTKQAIDFAASIGCKNLVFGCPKNRNMPDEANSAVCAEIAVRFLKELGDYAASRGTAIGMEANPLIYGTNFVNTTAEALSLVQKVASDGFKLNLDIGTMIQNAEPVSMLKGNVPLINHVHISESSLKKIEKRKLHAELISLLHSEKYAGFVSVEMGLQESISDIEDVMKYVGGNFR